MLKVAQPSVGKEEARTVSKVILSGRYISGEKVREFEEKFADHFGVRYGVAVNSGTAALHIALAVLGIGPGDEVIVPPLTFFSTVSAVLHQNAIPIFADIDPDSYCIDPQDIERKISKRTRCIIPVHLYGNSADMSRIVKIAKRYKLKVIEDAAQAHGTEYRGKKVGSIADIGVFSFFATKHMTTGEGGMLVTNNKKWAGVARMVRSHGMSDRDHHDYLGYNYRMNEMAGAMGLVQLTKLDKLNKKRIRASLYLINEINRRKLDWLRTPKLEKHIKHTFFWCPLLVDENKLGMPTRELVRRLAEKGIETRHRYWEPLYKQKVLIEKSAYPKEFPFNSKHYGRDIDYSKVYLRNTEKVAGRIIGLPNHPGLSKAELDRVIEVLTRLDKEERCAS